MRRTGRAALGALLALPVLGASAGPAAAASLEGSGGAPSEPSRAEYFAFRSRHPDLLEPNYLPFMLHEVEQGGEALQVACRWADADLPLFVYVEPPDIPPALRDDLHPKPPELYTGAVARALAAWEQGLDGRIRFRRVPSPGEASLRVQLVGAAGPHPDPSIKVLGSTPLRDACRATGGDPTDGRIEVRFEVPHVRIYVADEFGLLNPDQVERIALHELGHALGMRRHSRRPSDVMYERINERLIRPELSAEDVNSFLALYGLPNGTVYRRSSEAASAPAAPADAGAGAPSQAPGGEAPLLEVAPHVDARYGYELRTPRGWMRIETPNGVVAVDGVSWDFDATLQVIVRNYDTVRSYLSRYADSHMGGALVVERGEPVVAGRPAVRFRVRRPGGLAEELVFVEAGDGRVFILIGDCPAEEYERYHAAFRAALESFEIRPAVSPPGENETFPAELPPGGA